MPILEAKNLTKRFAIRRRVDVEVFRDLAFSLEEGELVTLIGPSGSGKSTLLHLLGTLDRPTSGEVVIEGKNVADMADKELSIFRNRRIGFIFQFHHLLPEFTAVENVAMPGMIAGQAFEEVRPRAEELLADAGLAERLDHRPSMLSGGEAQRVAVARAFLMRPAIILADEPTGNLDTHNSDILFKLMTDLSRKHHQTFLIATHNLDLARQADRVIHLENGQLTEGVPAMERDESPQS
ncbi:MAG: ABC transporter ATP-binding protein [Candidatus Kapaibacterium sp.]